MDWTIEAERQRLIDEGPSQEAIRRWHPKPGEQVRRRLPIVAVRRFPKARAEVLSTMHSGRCLIIAVRPARIKYFDRPKWCLIMGEGVLGWVLDFCLELNPEFLPPTQENT